MKAFSLSGIMRTLSFAGVALAPAAFGQQVTFAPYIQLGDNGLFGPTDQIVIAWQTDESAPNTSIYKVEFQRATEQGHGHPNRNWNSVNPQARVVDNYLATDPSLPPVPGAYGPHANYVAVLRGLRYDTEYQYRVTGPGMPDGGFTASFHTRKHSPIYSFIVEGDEGFFPATSDPSIIVNYEARIAHLIHNTTNLNVPGLPPRPTPDFIINTGDNVYNEGTEDNYRDFFFPVYNNDQDSNETGAPILRSTLFVPVAGNHDLGSSGVSANLLADNSAPTYSGNMSGGDGLVYFNDLYMPQNGPKGFDIQYQWNVNTSSPNNFTFSYQGQNYSSPTAIAAFRNSTKVDTGKGPSVQIDHQSNFSYDYGNAHIVYLDANPHLFNNNNPGGSPFNAASTTFVSYPTALAQWLIQDLDSSDQPWKIVVYHQPAFTSGDAAIFVNQMRTVAKLLEDHGVNVVFNGHDHNYQRTRPLRATARTADSLSTTGTPAVYVDQQFDGNSHTVPDGVLYLVEGAGGNRDFDGDYAPPRGSGLGLDQDDSATGTHVDEPGLTVPQGPASWLDDNLTNPEMINYLPNAGKGPKITVKFKAKVFSFGDVLVDKNKLTLYQISEPLQSTSSATSADPAPYGTDIDGRPLNDPIPDTQINPADGQLISAPATGTPALLDAWTITKPNVSDAVVARLVAPAKSLPGQTLTYTVTITNNSDYNLNGTQVRFMLPPSVTFAGTTGQTLTLNGNEVVLTIGRLAAGSEQSVQIPVLIAADARGLLLARAQVSSATTLSVSTNSATTVLSR
jgi:uncharacterized repeat protein (TIGR01451 family)